MSACFYYVTADTLTAETNYKKKNKKSHSSLVVSSHEKFLLLFDQVSRYVSLRFLLPLQYNTGKSKFVCAAQKLHFKKIQQQRESSTKLSVNSFHWDCFFGRK